MSTPEPPDPPEQALPPPELATDLNPDIVAAPEPLPRPGVGLAPQFRFLTDHNVPDSVGNVLRDLGHDVVRLREVMAIDTKDPIVAQAAIQDSRVLVSWDRDFNQQRFMSPRFAELSRLSMSGPEMEGAARIVAVLDLIEFVLRRAAGSPVTIRVGTGKVQISA